MTLSRGSHLLVILTIAVAPLLRAQPKADDVFRYLSRDPAGLAAMWAAYDRGDATGARLELLRYFQNRPDRLGTEFFATGKGNRALARSNARNEFAWKGTAKSFG